MNNNVEKRESEWELIVTTTIREVYKYNGNLISISKPHTGIAAIKKCDDAIFKIPDNIKFKNHKEVIQYIDENNLWLEI